MLITLAGVSSFFPTASVAGEAPSPSIATMQIVPGHPWRPPFGLDRVGRPPDAVVTFAGSEKPVGEFVVLGYRDGKEVSRQVLNPIRTKKDPWTTQVCLDPYVARVSLEDGLEEAALFFKSPPAGEPIELARQTVMPPSFEADAIAQPESVINPVDLGTILVPYDWLLLAGGQKATVEVAALYRGAGVPGASASAWYESAPSGKTTIPMPLKPGEKTQVTLAVGAGARAEKQDVLHVMIADAEGKALWQKIIRVMRVPDPPKNPLFGAITTKLRYDGSIVSIVNGKDVTIPYEKGWDPKLQDVVVFFPHGARWVFWRGASYCPFWASRFNTGLSYQWAERSPASDGIGWCEPLFDHELRFGRVEIITSTPSRVHVRWTYQTSDFAYRGSGDSIVEDFCFYPDGFGTRTVTMTTPPEWKYQLEELIILSPQASYPLDILPPNLVEIISLQGEKQVLTFPTKQGRLGNAESPVETLEQWPQNGSVPVLCRLRMNRRESLAAVTFPLTNPGKPDLFAPFYDTGAMVTPCYWGPHWPLSRGLDTGWTISDRVSQGPGANSVMCWPGSLGWHGQPAHKPFRETSVVTKDPAGKPRTMNIDTYVWLIGMSDANDEQLRQWAAGFAQPPVLEATGAKVEADWYVPERRALRLVVEKPIVTIVIKPAGHCVNPVFELSAAPKALKSVRVDGKRLEPARYAWDGKTLWLDMTLSQPATLQLKFVAADR
ncbi:MAG: hypothetical protein PHE83_14040 [Opitutaceae bacterium]|nr:hypothetical protein [Opitutaceae bacterium]